MWSRSLRIAIAAAVVPHVLSISLDLNNPGKISAWSFLGEYSHLGIDTVRSAAKVVAQDLMANDTKPDWWIQGLMITDLIDYWSLTGDSQYLNLTQQALVSQAGPQGNYMPDAQATSEASEDQGIWALAAMTAAEYSLPASGNFSWLDLARNVFEAQSARWDTATCHGGLRSGLFPYQSLYNIKDSVGNGMFMNLAARLALFTGNQTYLDWAEKVWEWSSAAGLVDATTHAIYDLTFVEGNCSEVTNWQWTSNYGVFLSSAAIAYNQASRVLS
jgi:mannan endo-1,6-alpha-mannosidase